MVDVFSPPDASNPYGVKGKVPASQLMDFYAKGFHPAVQVTNPEGQRGWLPPALVGDYTKNKGFKLGPPEQQNLDQVAQQKQVGPIANAAFNTLRPFYLGDPEHNRGPLDQLGYELKSLVTHPVDTAKQTVMQPINAYTQGVNQEFGTAKEQAAKGDTAGAIAHTAYGMIPFIGPQAGTAAEQLRSGDTSGGIGTMASIGLQALSASPETGEMAAKPVTALTTKSAALIKQTAQAVKVARNPVAAAETLPAESLAIKATKPRNSINNIQQQMQSALPDARRAADSMGMEVKTLDDARAAALKAKQDVWDEYTNNHLEPGKQSGATIDGNKIADAMESKITRTMQLENPANAKAIQETADLYRRPIPLSEAEQLLQDSNNSLNSYYAKTKVSQRVAARDPETGPEVAKADALRQELNTQLDQLTGPGAKELKQRYGALQTFEDVLNRRINVAERAAPESLIEQMAKKDAAIGAGKGIFKMITGSPIAGAADVYGAYKGLQAAKDSRLANDSNFLIGNAFKKTQPTAAPSAPSIMRIFSASRQLPSGPVITPAPADTSGSMAYTPPPVAQTTRAQRLGLLLPEKTAVELPPSSMPTSTEGVLPAQRIVTRDPASGRMKTMYGSSADSGKPVYQGNAAPQQSQPAASPPPSLMDMITGRNQRVETIGVPPSTEPHVLGKYLNVSDVMTSKSGAVQVNAKNLIERAGFQQQGQRVGNVVKIIDPMNPDAPPATMTIQEIKKGGLPAIRRKMQSQPAPPPKPAAYTVSPTNAFQQAIDEVGGTGKSFEDLTPEQQHNVVELAQIYRRRKQ